MFSGTSNRVVNRRSGWVWLLLPVLMGLASCSAKTLPLNAQSAMALEAMAENTVAVITKQFPELESRIQNSLAYAVLDWELTKIPIVGVGSGEGVLAITYSGEKTYIEASRYDVGGGVGKRSYKSLIVIESPALLERAMEGSWLFLAGSDSAGFGGADSHIRATSGDGYTLYVLHKTGTLVSVTARAIRIRRKR